MIAPQIIYLNYHTWPLFNYLEENFLKFLLSFLCGPTDSHMKHSVKLYLVIKQLYAKLATFFYTKMPAC